MHKKNCRRPSFSPSPILNHSLCLTPLSYLENISPNRIKNSSSKQSFTPKRQLPKSPNIAYLTDILESLYQKQFNPLDGLSDLFNSGSSPNLRYCVVEWIARLCKHFSLRRSVMYTTVSIIDRSLHHLFITKDQMQLLGGTCFWLSVKFHCPNVVRLAQIISECGTSYEKDDFINCEASILDAVNYNINAPNVSDFLNLLEENMACDRPLLLLLWTLGDIMLQFSGFLRFKPSTIATAVMIYSLNCLKRTFQSDIVTKMTNSEDSKILFNCIEEIHNIVCDLLKKRKNSYLEHTSPSIYGQAFKWLSKATLPDVGSFLHLIQEAETC